MNRLTGTVAIGWLVPALLGLGGAQAAQDKKPSRAAADKCAWEHIQDRTAGMAAWVQRCDFGDRKISLAFESGALVMRYSDGSDVARVVEIIDVGPGETGEEALKRIFAEKTDKTLAAQCRLAPYLGHPGPAGVRRFDFVPNAAYAKRLKATAKPDEVPEPACGDWGEAPDSVEYFEVPKGKPRKVLFVRVGQDEPLFDEQSLEVLPPGP